MSEKDPPTPGRSPGLGFHLVLLTVSLLLTYPIFAWLGYRAHGSSGIGAATVALVVCGTTAGGALLLVGLTRGTPAALQATLLGMLLRTGVPLIVGVLLNRTGGELARAGVFGMILCYYLLALAIETLLSVRLLAQSGNAPTSEKVVKV